MAKINVQYFDKHGYTGEASFSVVEAGMSVEDKLKICLAGAEVLLRRLREFLRANTNDPNADVRGRLAESLTVQPNETTGSVFISPQGKHHGRSARRTRAEGYHRAKTGQGKAGRQGHHGMTAGVSARDVGYYLEYGTPRMAPLHWMETVCEQADDEVQAAMEKAWDDYLTSKGF